MRKVDLDDNDVSELMRMFESGNVEPQHPTFSKIVSHLYQQCNISPSLTFRVKGYMGNRDQGMVVPPEKCKGRVFLNLNCREIYSFAENKVKEQSYLVESGDFVILPEENCSTKSFVVDKASRQKLKTTGREIGLLRPRNYKRLTLVFDFIIPEEQPTEYTI